MARIEWSDAFSVGVPELDAQHRRWIDMINELHDIMLEGTGFTDAIRDKLEEMREYGRTHFAAEEAWMRRIGYPGAKEHGEQHAIFLAELDGYMADYRRMLPTDLLRILTGWLKNHIMVHDMKYREFIDGS